MTEISNPCLIYYAGNKKK